ncbi:4a-hydroxytetrahydrobiopterin dehydratase [Candidatus Dojkabacteria bacterium]|uniref:4a-hydroxytetrahydrobiopterin dehydratase n=1 Tax=Candidatus Dojkabacteria bacterium TaxID=2099670 RepID=A0A955L8Q6_9BACT|nr:4a-hydroxytetrahydrobiopterin dehydratase [Candidatus Dojkabacteria bacterium]
MKWQKEGEVLIKEFEFSNFTEAVKFVDSIVPLANDSDHHPDVLIHSYKKVKISLTTHSEGKVTQKDYDLAEKIDSLV